MAPGIYRLTQKVINHKDENSCPEKQLAKCKYSRMCGMQKAKPDGKETLAIRK